MPYSDLAAIYSSLPEADVAQLTDDDAGTTVDENRVDEAIAKADGLIDAFLRSKPADGEVPVLLTQISVSLAIFYLYERQMGTNMPESVESSYKRQTDLLKLIQSGKINLGLATEEPTTEGGVFHKTNKTADDRMFGADTLEMY